MTRVAIAFVALLFFLGSAPAMLAPRNDPFSYRKNSPRQLMTNLPRGLVKGSSRQVVNDPSRHEQKEEFRITDQTEVRLNGRQCKYEDVPLDAVIILLEVDSDDNKAILRIHFRSKNGR